MERDPRTPSRRRDAAPRLTWGEVSVTSDELTSLSYS